MPSFSCLYCGFYTKPIRRRLLAKEPYNMPLIYIYILYNTYTTYYPSHRLPLDLRWGCSHASLGPEKVHDSLQRHLQTTPFAKGVCHSSVDGPNRGWLNSLWALLQWWLGAGGGRTRGTGWGRTWRTWWMRPTCKSEFNLQSYIGPYVLDSYLCFFSLSGTMP